MLRRAQRFVSWSRGTSNVSPRRSLAAIAPQSPFKGGAEDEIFEAILESEIHFPSRLHPAARNLLERVRVCTAPLAILLLRPGCSRRLRALYGPWSCSQLLERDPAKRLGGGPRDALDVKEHPYFQGIDWQALLRKEVDINYRPQLVRGPSNGTHPPSDPVCGVCACASHAAVGRSCHRGKGRRGGVCRRMHGTRPTSTRSLRANLLRSRRLTRR